MSPELQIGVQVVLGALVMLMGVIQWLVRLEVARMIASIAELRQDNVALEVKLSDMNKEIQVLRIEQSARDRSNTFFEGAVRDMATDMKKLFERMPQLESRLAMLEREKRP